jgi:hypothetical protein
MTKKQLVDNYLSKNANKVETWRNQKGFSWKEVAEDLGDKSVDGEYIRSRYKSFRRFVTPTPSSKGEYTFNEGKEDKFKGIKEFTFTADNIPTEQEIIEHFNIDTTKYRINQIYHKTSFGGKYSITVSCLALKGNQTIDLDNSFLEKLSNIQPLEKSYTRYPLIDLPKASLIIPKQDSHWNKKDIDGNNSIEDRFASFTKTLLNQLEKTIKVNQLEEIVYIVGSDEFNSEWTSATTKGTPQQDTLSYSKSFEKISEFNIEIIKLLRYYSPKVKVMLLNGNHDHNVSWHLAHLLKHVFSKNEAIEIDDSLTNTKFYSYKGTLTLLNHGDAIKPKDLAAKFPILAKEMWSQHSNFIVLTGDKHHEVAHDFNGITWYQVPQLSNARSAWDDKCGHGTSKAELLSFVLEEGHLSNIFRTPIK